MMAMSQWMLPCQIKEGRFHRKKDKRTLNERSRFIGIIRADAASERETLRRSRTCAISESPRKRKAYTEQAVIR